MSEKFAAKQTVQYIIRTTPPLKGQLTFKLCGKKF